MTKLQCANIYNNILNNKFNLYKQKLNYTVISQASVWFKINDKLDSRYKRKASVVPK